MNRTRLKALVEKHEGVRAMPYVDTAGKVTIGVGRNLTDRGLLPCEIDFLLDNDINDARSACQRTFPGFDTFTEARQHAFIDMAINLGERGVREFTKMIDAVEHRDWDAAAREMLDSKAARQTGSRYAELASMVRVG